jgi:hypothetical protein
MKDIKGSYPVQLAEYATQRRIAGEPAFTWWICNVLQKRNRIIVKLKTKYWVRTHKVGVKIPKTVKEAKIFDKENGNTLWWDAICKEMKTFNQLLKFGTRTSQSCHPDIKRSHAT